MSLVTTECLYIHLCGAWSRTNTSFLIRRQPIRGTSHIESIKHRSYYFIFSLPFLIYMKVVFLYLYIGIICGFKYRLKERFPRPNRANQTNTMSENHGSYSSDHVVMEMNKKVDIILAKLCMTQTKFVDYKEKHS